MHKATEENLQNRFLLITITKRMNDLDAHCKQDRLGDARQTHNRYKWRQTDRQNLELKERRTIERNSV